MSRNMSRYKEYLGDGVYANFDGFGVVLTTENGVEATNTIVLEPEVLRALDHYRERLKNQQEGELATPKVSEQEGQQ